MQEQNGRARMHLDVVTPQKIEFSGEVDMVVAPGYDGYLGILPSHIPMMTRLRVGVLKIYDGTKEINMAVSEGYMEVTGEKIIILAEAAELPEEIDVERALVAKRRAEERLASLAAWDVKALKAHASLQRALNRLKVAGKAKNKIGHRE